MFSPDHGQFLQGLLRGLNRANGLDLKT